MTTMDYARFNTHQLGDLLERSKGTEEGFQDRLEIWRRKLADANDLPTPDPVGKRLAFLLADARNQRRAVEQELAMRSSDDSARCRDVNRRTEKSAAAYDDTFAATRQMVPAVVV